MKQIKYGFIKTVDLSFDQAIEKVTEELKKEGFGVLTEIDVKETLKKKLDVNLGFYKILGACNPGLAHRALQAEETIGLMLPCNVIVYINDRGETVVGVVDPVASMQAVDNPELAEVAGWVREKLKLVFERVN